MKKLLLITVVFLGLSTSFISAYKHKFKNGTKYVIGILAADYPAFGCSSDNWREVQPDQVIKSDVGDCSLSEIRAALNIDGHIYWAKQVFGPKNFEGNGEWTIVDRRNQHGKFQIIRGSWNQ